VARTPSISLVFGENQEDNIVNTTGKKEGLKII
jgi:hypothetical protein